MEGYQAEFLTAKAVLLEFIKEIKLIGQSAGCKQLSFLALFERHSEDYANIYHAGLTLTEITASPLRLSQQLEELAELEREWKSLEEMVSFVR